MRLSPPHIPTIHLHQTYSMYHPSRLSDGKEEQTKYVHAHEASPKVELTTSSLPSVSFPCVETISGVTEQANHVSLVSNSSSLHENFCFPCVKSMPETTEQANIQSLFQTHNASLIYPPTSILASFIEPI